jgi:hypothetical protein
VSTSKEVVHKQKNIMGCESARDILPPVVEDVDCDVKKASAVFVDLVHEESSNNQTPELGVAISLSGADLMKSRVH